MLHIRLTDRCGENMTDGNELEISDEALEAAAGGVIVNRTTPNTLPGGPLSTRTDPDFTITQRIS